MSELHVTLAGRRTSNLSLLSASCNALACANSAFILSFHSAAILSFWFCNSACSSFWKMKLQTRFGNSQNAYRQLLLLLLQFCTRFAVCSRLQLLHLARVLAFKLVFPHAKLTGIQFFVFLALRAQILFVLSSEPVLDLFLRFIEPQGLQRTTIIELRDDVNGVITLTSHFVLSCIS